MEHFFVFASRAVFALIAGMVMAFITRSKNAVLAFAFITMGASTVCFISSEYLKHFSVFTNSDPGRLIAQVVVVVGFITGGVLLISGKEGKFDLSPYASMWLSSIIGIIIGIGMIKLAFMAVAAVFFIYYVTDTKLLKRFR